MFGIFEFVDAYDVSDIVRKILKRFSFTGAGPCNGDSGGGMFFHERSPDGSKRWMIRGVVSLSLQDEKTKQCDLGNFIVFTDVAKYVPWIKRVMAQYKR
jgi:secreted trypsin-like serine protease